MPHGNGQRGWIPAPYRRVRRSLTFLGGAGNGQDHDGCPYNRCVAVPIFIANPPLRTNADPIFMIRGAGILPTSALSPAPVSRKWCTGRGTCGTLPCE